VLCSAKTGLGVEDVLESLILKVPPPEGDPDAPLQALIVDSWFDNYVGVVMLVRVVNGTLRPKDKILLMATGAQQLVEQRRRLYAALGCSCSTLRSRPGGFIIAGIKELKAAKVGDTVTLAAVRPQRRCPASRKCSRRCLPACSRSRQISTTRCATRWKN
jgi:GTP-binding protein LepA